MYVKWVMSTFKLFTIMKVQSRVLYVKTRYIAICTMVWTLTKGLVQSPSGNINVIIYDGLVKIVYNSLEV